MSTVNDFVSALATGNLVQANTVFGELMHDRLAQGLDDKKIELAQGMIGIQNNEDTEEDDENAEVSGVS